MPREVDMVGMDGVLHTYPEWFYLLLKGMNRQLVRSNAAPILGRTGDRRHLTILPLAVAVLRPLLEDVPHYSPVRRVRAFNPGFRSGRPHRSGRRGLLDLLECGIDHAVARRYLVQSLQTPRTFPLLSRQGGGLFWAGVPRRVGLNSPQVERRSLPGSAPAAMSPGGTGKARNFRDSRFNRKPTVPFSGKSPPAIPARGCPVTVHSRRPRGGVVGDAEQIKVKLANGKEYDAKVVGRDPKTDLALVKIDGGKDLHPLSLGNSEALKVGSWVVAVGSPFGLEQTPLVNMKGEVVGINTAINPSGRGIG